MILVFFWCSEGCKFEVESSEDGFLNRVGSIGSIPRAEKTGSLLPYRFIGEHGPISLS